MRIYIAGAIAASLIIAPLSVVGPPVFQSSANRQVPAHTATYDPVLSSEYDYEFDEPGLEESDEFLMILNEDDEELLESVEALAEAFEEAEANYDGELYADPSDEVQSVLYSTIGWKSFNKCVANGAANVFGLDILKRAINKKVVKALKSRQYKKATSIIHTNISKIAGKKYASKVIKFMARKLLPGGLPAQLSWVLGKCGLKQIRSLNV